MLITRRTPHFYAKLYWRQLHWLIDFLFGHMSFIYSILEIFPLLCILYISKMRMS